ncbi:unnamed protein product [Linum trigynum]|uniref:Uncharacterized protein n=1 Tax=Linum trigynum TaxID=586398 RepID=A0AAV2G9H8_9ROSI
MVGGDYPYSSAIQTRRVFHGEDLVIRSCEARSLIGSEMEQVVVGKLKKERVTTDSGFAMVCDLGYVIGAGYSIWGREYDDDGGSMISGGRRRRWGV